LANTLRREFAIGSAEENNCTRKYKLLRSVENVYIVIGVIICLICIVGAPSIAENWLNIEELNTGLVSKVICLMGISISLQLVSNLYAGCMFGLGHQIRANVYCVSWSVAKSCGSIGVILITAPNLLNFYFWHIITDIIYLLILRRSVVQKLKVTHKLSWSIKDFSNISSIWKYTMGIFVISIISLVNRQLDKLIISNTFSLTELGAYNIATTLGSLTAIVPSAIYTSVFPRFTAQLSLENQKNVHKEFLAINRTVNIFVSCMSAFIAVYSLPLIEVWTQSKSYHETLAGVAPLVVLAVSMIEYQEIPYAYALAHGNTKINVLVGLIFIPIMGICNYWAISNFGLIGAGWAYFSIMLLQTLVYQFLIYRKYLKIPALMLIVKDTIMPLIASILLGIGCKTITNILVSNVYIEVLVAALCGGMILILLLLVYDREIIRSIFRKFLK